MGDPDKTKSRIVKTRREKGNRQDGVRGELRHDSRARKDGAENFEGISFAVIAFSPPLEGVKGRKEREWFATRLRGGWAGTGRRGVPSLECGRDL